MHYLPEIAIVNNIEFDHADIYRDLQEIKFAFSRLMNLVPANGRLIVGVDSPIVREVWTKCAGGFTRKSKLSALSDDAKWQARYIDFSGELTRFTVFKEGEIMGRI